MVEDDLLDERQPEACPVVFRQRFAQRVGGRATTLTLLDTVDYGESPIESTAASSKILHLGVAGGGSGRTPNTATFSNDDPNRIRVVSPGNPANFWTRDRRASRAALWAGTWKSTTGNIFTVSARRGPFHIILTRTNGRKEVFVANWVEEMVGTQFEYGSPPNTVTYNPRSRARVRVTSANGTVNWWQKL